MKSFKRRAPAVRSEVACRIERQSARVVVAAMVTLGAAAAIAQDRPQQDVDDVLTVTVTAERLNRSLMDTSTSVVVLDAEALARRPFIDGTSDLLSRIPNITSLGRGNLAPTVRGVDGTGPATGSTAFLAGTRARLNIQIDGRPASYNEIVFGDAGIWDVKQVEVLRGAQSALQGRNAIAGTLALKTKDPTYDAEAQFRVLGGNLQTRQYSAAVSAPIVDEQLAFRIAADRKTSESFVLATPFPGVDNPREYEATTYRGKLLFEPKALDAFSALVTVNHSDFTGPQFERLTEPVENRISSSDTQFAVFQPRTTNGIVDLRWQASDQLSFQTLLSATDLTVKRYARPGNGSASIDAREYVIEPSARFEVMNGRVSGLAGLYFFDAEQDEFLDFAGGGSFDDSTRTTAAFWETTFGVTERFDVTLGARYEEEKRRRNGALAVFLVNLDETYDVFLPKLVLSWSLTDHLTIGAFAARGYNGGGAGVTFAPPFDTFLFEPEYVWTYEAFTRASLADGRLAVTANLFFSDYKDMQLPFNLTPQAVVIRNADQVATQGAEVSISWQALPSLRLSGGLGILETEIEEYPGSGLVGNELANAPGLTANLGVSYAHTGLELSIDTRYSEAYYSDQFNSPLNRSDAYWLVNAQAGYTFSRVRVFGYASNLFDSDKRTSRLTRAPPLGAAVDILRPRTYGVGIQVAL